MRVSLVIANRGELINKPKPLVQIRGEISINTTLICSACSVTSLRTAVTGCVILPGTEDLGADPFSPVVDLVWFNV